MTEKIEIEFEYTGGYGDGEYCTVCGEQAHSEVLCEGHAESGELIRVCETCLEAGDIDSRLQQHAAEVDKFAAYLRGLVGTIKAPSFAHWKAAVEAIEAEDERADAELELAEGSEAA
jgi:hypothetical protein